MKNLREYYLGCLEAEKPKFVRVLKAVPGDQAAYRPHPRCKCAGDLVWLLASELQDACEVVEQGTVSFVARPAPPVAESIAEYERNIAELQKRVARLDDARWDKKAQFLVDGRLIIYGVLIAVGAVFFPQGLITPDLLSRGRRRSE